MKKLLATFAIGIASISSAQAGKVSIQNMDANSGRCILKFYTTYTFGSKNTASQVMGLPPVGKTMEKDIPNGTYKAILLECKLQESYPNRPSDINHKMPDPPHIVACNSNEPYGMQNYMTPVTIKKDSPTLILAVDFSRKENSSHCAFLNKHEFGIE